MPVAFGRRLLEAHGKADSVRELFQAMSSMVLQYILRNTSLCAHHHLENFFPLLVSSILERTSAAQVQLL